MKNEITAAPESTALTIAGSFSLQPMTDDLAEIIADEMDGLGTIPFDIVKIPSAGGLAFEVPGVDEAHPTITQELIGIILDHHPANSWWMSEFTGGNEQPDCSSIDGKNGLMTSTGEVRYCEDCPMNEFGSGKDGSKACKNLHRVYLLRSGEPLPIILQIPPTSLKALKNYLGKRVVIQGKRSWQVLTKITLAKATSNGGITYSQAVFTKAGDLTPEECAQVAPIAAAIKSMARQAEPIDEPSAAQSVEFTELSDEASNIPDAFKDASASDPAVFQEVVDEKNQEKLPL
jgi:hypothetical protein